METSAFIQHPEKFTCSPHATAVSFEEASMPARLSCVQPLTVITPGAWRLAADHCIVNKYVNVAIISDSVIDQHFGSYMKECLGNNFDLAHIDGAIAKKKGELLPDPYKLHNIDVILGIGGGTNIDQAKLFAKRNAKPWIALPTKPTAAIVSGHASITKNGNRVSEPTKNPEAVFIDEDLFNQVDLMCLKSEFGDSLSSLSAVGDAYLANIDRKTPVKSLFLKSAYMVATRALGIDDITSSEGIRRLYETNLEYAEIMKDYKSSLPCSGSEHAVSHALDTLGSRQLHGIQVGFTTLVATQLQSTLRDLADRFQREEIPQVPTEQLRESLEKHGFPTRLSDLGIRPGVFAEALHKAPTVRAVNDRRYTVLDRFCVEDIMANLAKAELL